jgi:hypothetical protein
MKKPPAPLLATVTVLVAVALAVLVDTRGTGAFGGDQGFSVDRARADLSVLGRTPHPSGTPAHEAVRDHIVRALAASSLDPRVSTDTPVLPMRDQSHVAADVRNVTATIPGRDSTGRVLLVAHYDSVSVSPGASDNGLGVASLLEIARVLGQGSQPRNDVTLLFTDSEEFAQLGARAFLGSGAGGDPGRTVVLNLDARGTSGRVVMFETGPGSAAVLPALRHRPPATTSLAAEVYRHLPHETDFTQFREAGFAGLNFALVGGSAYYHTPRDDLANARPESLRDMGTTVLAATRELAAADLSAVGRDREVTYFTLAGLLVRYPAGLVLPLAVLAAVAVAAAVGLLLRRGRARTRALLVAAGTFPLVPLAAAALGWAGWRLVTLARPDYLTFPYGDPYRADLAKWGFAVAGVAVGGLWLLWRRRHGRDAEVHAAVVAWLALLALVAAVLAPGAAYLFTWPALAGAAGLAVLARLPEDSPWRSPVSLAAGAPAALLVVPLAVLLFGALGLATALAPLALLGLAGTLVLPALAGPARPRALAAGLAAVVVAGAGLVVAGTATDRVGPATPARVDLAYGLDADAGRAYWLSEDPAPHPWVRRHVGDRTMRLDGTFPNVSAADLRAGDAPVAPIPTPTLTAVEVGRNGATRDLRVRLGARDGRPALLALYVDTTGGASVEGATLGATRLSGGVNRVSVSGPWRWGLVFAAPPSEVELVLTVRGGPVRLMALAQVPELPATALAEPQPRTVTWASDATGMAFATRLVQI